MQDDHGAREAFRELKKSSQAGTCSGALMDPSISCWRDQTTGGTWERFVGISEHDEGVRAMYCAQMSYNLGHWLQVFFDVFQEEKAQGRVLYQKFHDWLEEQGVTIGKTWATFLRNLFSLASS